MTTFVQIAGRIEEAKEVVPFVSNEEADFFGVYIGKAGQYEWQADFLHYEDALTYAIAVSRTYGYLIDDKTYLQGNFNETAHKH